MITEIKLKDWKSFGESTLLIDQITFLIGTNASGKSNIIDALKLLSLLATGERLSEVCKRIRGGLDQLIRRGRDASSIEVVFKTDSAKYKYSLTFSVDKVDAEVVAESLAVEARDEWKFLFFTEKSVKDERGERLIVSFQKDKPGAFKQLELTNSTTVLSQVRGLNVIKEIKEGADAALRTFSSIFILEPNPANMRGSVQLSEILRTDGSNVAGVIAGLPDGKAKEFVELLTKYVSKLPERDLRRVWAERIGRFMDLAMLYCEERWDEDGDGMEMDARSMSDGTLRFIAIIVALLTRASDSLIVIEEIDNGLHPSRAGELMTAITEIATERDFDVLCTTHNPVLMDVLIPEILKSVSCVNREGHNGTSHIFRYTERPEFLKELSRYTPGGMMVNNIFSRK